MGDYCGLPKPAVCPPLPIESDLGACYCFHGRPAQEVGPMDVVKIIFAILLPPVGVFLEVGPTGHFWLNILLTLLGYIPGLIHAVWIIARR